MFSKGRLTIVNVNNELCAFSHFVFTIANDVMKVSKHRFQCQSCKPRPSTPLGTAAEDLQGLLGLPSLASQKLQTDLTSWTSRSCFHHGRLDAVWMLFGRDFQAIP